ncbi:hypothetical protein [Petroclostridium sp. X23]|uniref:hypothetical protein n=1 Tax=Petroclostridium sp. X23 TaxID=3045146 RepID=UPI0024ADD323|nr:hypothetical protein [Petroclostridium sp. X23]WHH59142.1 hypothetical protein QKW49_25710 [Petroclostridium sp. X23]
MNSLETVGVRYSVETNLCDTCQFNIPECNAKYEEMEFGNDIGNDNVIKCSAYIKISD